MTVVTAPVVYVVMEPTVIVEDAVLPAVIVEVRWIVTVSVCVLAVTSMPPASVETVAELVKVVVNTLVAVL